MSETAMRDADGNAVFVANDGSYTSEFPETHIVRRADGDEVEYIVYGFVGDNHDYEEQEFVFETEDEAVDAATEMYGEDGGEAFEKNGEVFEVEVHEVDA